MSISDLNKSSSLQHQRQKPAVGCLLTMGDIKADCRVMGRIQEKKKMRREKGDLWNNECPCVGKSEWDLENRERGLLIYIRDRRKKTGTKGDKHGVRCLS